MSKEEGPLPPGLMQVKTKSAERSDTRKRPPPPRSPRRKDPYPHKSPSRKKRSPPLEEQTTREVKGLLCKKMAKTNPPKKNPISPLTPLSKAKRRPRVALIDSSAGATPPPQQLYTSRYINRRNEKVAKLNEAYKSEAIKRGSITETEEPFPKLPSYDENKGTPELTTPVKEPPVETPEGTQEITRRKSVDDSSGLGDSEGDYMRVRHMPVSEALDYESLKQSKDQTKEDLERETKADIETRFRRRPSTETSIIGAILRDNNTCELKDSLKEDSSMERERRSSAPDDLKIVSNCQNCCCSSTKLFLVSVDEKDMSEIWSNLAGQSWTACSKCKCCKGNLCECSCLGYNRDLDVYRRASEGSFPSNIKTKEKEDEKKQSSNRRRSISEPRGRPDGPNGLTGKLPAQKLVYYTINPWILDDTTIWPESQLRRLCSMLGLEHDYCSNREELNTYLAKVHHQKITLTLNAEDLQYNKYTGLIEGGYGFTGVYFNQDFLPKKFRTHGADMPRSKRLIGIIKDRNKARIKNNKIQFSPYNQFKNYECDPQERKDKLTRLVEISTISSLGVNEVEDCNGRKITPEMILINPTMELATDPQWTVARTNMFENIRKTSLFERTSIESDWLNIWEK